ncbi:hypothetical protein BDV33DRAFT_99778 [Aspergillus novoparasiticus]|uniref:Uncharacterized protein n=1 Tax=Aspergillus novoparasiticus TaxID=986946 RepID=A0A5N6E703_9EURO|nr:hypothetical protein BDV33DRAFT_99778 [Aspergillus novoparasiticus]
MRTDKCKYYSASRSGTTQCHSCLPLYIFGFCLSTCNFVMQALKTSYHWYI